MQAILEKNQLLKALNHVQNVVEKRKTTKTGWTDGERPQDPIPAEPNWRSIQSVQKEN